MAPAGFFAATFAAVFLWANAEALLIPIDWAEPFGLVMFEAMAFGTPVIAWKRGRCLK